MMATAAALRLARRELRGGVRGFRLFLACLAVGVAAIAGVASLSQSILAGMARDGQRILGGDVSLRVTHRPLAAAQISYLRREAALSRTVFMRTMARAGADRTLVELKAVDGAYPLFGRLALDPARAGALARRDGMWGAAVDPILLRRLGLDVGGVLVIGETRFRIRARVADEPDRLGGAGMMLGPRVLIADAALPETGLVRPGSLIRYLYRLRLKPGVGLEGWKARLAAAYPGAPWLLRDRTRASPSVQRFVDRAALFMTLVGLTALLVGGVGIGNSVRHYLAGRAETIATLKCLGATSGIIFRVYVAQIATMALLGTAIGIAAGAAVPFAVAGTVAGQFAVAVAPGLFPGALALAAAFGLLTALAFSLFPLARACAIPPGSLFRDLVAPARARPSLKLVVAAGGLVAGLAGLAVATATDRLFALWFVAGAAGALILFRLAGTGVAALARALPAPGPGLRLALANIHRPGAPTVSVVVSLGLGLTVLVAVALIEGNMAHQISRAMPSRAPGYYFVDIQPGQVAAFERTVRAQPGVTELRRMPMLRGRITAIAGVPVARAAIAPGQRWMIRGDRGITWSAAVPEDTRVVAGSWWPEDYKGPPLVSLSRAAAGGFGIGIGDTITFNILGRAITARVANLRDIRWRSLSMNFTFVFSPGMLEHAPQTHIATVRLTPEAEAGLERRIGESFANVTAIRVRSVLEAVGGIMGRIAVAVRATAAVTLIAGTLVLAGVVASGHRRRVYDAVVLKVLGATRGRILAAILAEYGVVGLATAAIAAALGTLAAWAVVRFVMRVEWVFLPWTVALTSALAAAATLGFGLIGTWRALGQKPAPLLRNR